MDIEKIKEFCREQLKSGVSQTDLAAVLTTNAKEKPKQWQIGSAPSWSSQKLHYYLKKWDIATDGGERVEKPKKTPEFFDFDTDKPSASDTTYVFVAVPQSKLSTVLGALQ